MKNQMVISFTDLRHILEDVILQIIPRPGKESRMCLFQARLFGKE